MECAPDHMAQWMGMDGAFSSFKAVSSKIDLNHSERYKSQEWIYCAEWNEAHKGIDWEVYQMEYNIAERHILERIKYTSVWRVLNLLRYNWPAIKQMNKICSHIRWTVNGNDLIQIYSSTWSAPNLHYGDFSCNFFSSPKKTWGFNLPWFIKLYIPF